MVKLIACVACLCLFFFYGFQGNLARGTENEYGVVTKVCDEDIPMKPDLDENKCKAACKAKYNAFSVVFGHNRCICYYYNCKDGNTAYCYEDLLIKGCKSLGETCYRKCMDMGSVNGGCEDNNTCRCDVGNC